MTNIQNEINEENVDEINLDNASIGDYLDPLLREPENEIVIKSDQPNVRSSNSEELIHTSIHDNITLRRSNCVRRPT